MTEFISRCLFKFASASSISKLVRSDRTNVFIRCVHNVNQTQQPHVFSNPSVSKKEYFMERGLSENDFNRLSRKYKIRCSKPKRFVLADSNVAADIVNRICKNLHSNNVLEFDAGLGVVSNMLIEKSLNCRLYERDELLLNHMSNKFDNCADNVKLFDRGFSNLSGIICSQEDFARDEFNRLFTDVPLNAWDENIHISFIIYPTQVKHLRSLLSCYIEEDRLRKFGTPEIFLITYAQDLKDIKCNKLKGIRGRNMFSYIFNVFYNYEILLKDVDRMAFLPWPSVDNVNKGIAQPFCLLRITPKWERFPPHEDENFLKFFMTLNLATMKKNNRIIQCFESFANGCGIRLIVEENITPYTDIFDITPERYYELAKKLFKYPELHYSKLDNN